MNVLFRAPNWVGDAVLALPSVAALAADPHVRLTVLAPIYVHPVFEGLPGVHLSPVDPRVRNALHARALGEALRADDDVGILCPVSFSSALVFFLARIPRRVGRTTDARGLLLTERLAPRPEPRHPILPLDPGAGGGQPQGESPAPFHRWRDYAELTEWVLQREIPERYPLQVPAPAGQRAEDLLADLAGSGPLVALNPGANGPARRWPSERFAEVGRRLRGELDARIAVLGGPREIDLSRRVAGAIPGAGSLAGRTNLKSLMGVLERLDLFLTNDTGPMHLAAALGTPLLDLCGAADERVTGPRGRDSRVLREFLFCSPCVKNACPYNLECMEALTVEAVLASARATLHAGRSHRGTVAVVHGAG